MNNTIAYNIKKNIYLKDEQIPVIEISYGVFPKIEEENDSIKISFSKYYLKTSVDDIEELHKSRKLFNLSIMGLKSSIADSSNFYISDYKFTTELVELYFKKLYESHDDCGFI